MSAEPAANTREPADQQGIVCPKCGSAHFPVIYTRRSRGGKIVRRRDAGPVRGRVRHSSASFAEKGVQWHKNGPLMERGEGQMGNVGYDKFAPGGASRGIP